MLKIKNKSEKQKQIKSSRIPNNDYKCPTELFSCHSSHFATTTLRLSKEIRLFYNVNSISCQYNIRCPRFFPLQTVYKLIN